MKNRLMLPNGLYQCFAQSLKVQSATHKKKKGRFLKKSNQDSLKKGKLFHSTLQMGIRRFQSSKCIKTKGVEVLHASIGTSISKFLTLGCSDISTEHLIFNLENV